MIISNLHLMEKCKRYILNDPKKTNFDELIKDTLISSFRELSDLGAEPLAWNRETYDEIFTRYYATISDITTANPGVITADSLDPDLTDDHGFQTGDIVYLEGINGESQAHKLNNRLFRAVRTAATTLTLKTLDGQTDITTAAYDDYDSGGTIYHAGIVLPTSTIEPTSSSTYNDWNIKRVFDVNFDLYPCNPITEAPGQLIAQPGSRPERWRYQQYAYGSFETPEHLLFWYNFPSTRYNVKVYIEKEYPDPSEWTAEAYLPCPGHIHEYVWHRALSNLAMHSEKQRRATKDGGNNTKIEVLNANYWMAKAIEEETKLLAYNRKLSGGKAYMSQGMSA